MEKFHHELIHYETDTGMRFSVESTNGFSVSKHWHNSLEIIMVLDGIMDISIGERDFQISSGGFAVIDSKTIHSTACKESCRYLLLQIPYDIIKKNISEIEFISLRCICRSEEECLKEYEKPAQILKKLSKLYFSRKDSGYLLLFNSLVYEFLYYIVTYFRMIIDPSVKKKSEKNIQRLGVILDYVRQHYAESISLESAAKAVSLNREYFARFFKKYMGVTFMDYVFAIRLEHAYNDIVETDMPITEIVIKNGFKENYKLFITKFTQAYGLKPSQKRKQLGK